MTEYIWSRTVNRGNYVLHEGTGPQGQAVAVETCHSSPDEVNSFQLAVSKAKELNGFHGVRKIFDFSIDKRPAGVTSFLVYEGDCVSLKEKLQTRQRLLGTNELRSLLLQLQAALRTLHSQNWYHGGLTAHSVYMKDNEWVIGDFVETWVNLHTGNPPISPFSDPRGIDYKRGDLYSLALIVIYAATGQVATEFPLDPNAAIKKLHDLLRCEDLVLLVFHLMFPPPPGEELVETGLMCSFCTEPEGVINALGQYSCLNHACEKYKPQRSEVPQVPGPQVPGLQVPALCPADPDRAPHTKLCNSCSNRFLARTKPKRWESLVTNLPPSMLHDLCSLACFESYCRNLGIENETANRCAVCLKNQQGYALPCSERHFVCSERCFARTKVKGCPRCVRPAICCKCAGRQALKKLKCGHWNCEQCLASQGPRKCMEPSCQKPSNA